MVNDESSHTTLKSPHLDNRFWGHFYNLQRELQRELIAVNDWDEIAASLFRFITNHIPLAGLSLHVYNQISEKYEIVAEIFPSKETNPPVHCLPLIHGSKQIALLYLYLFPDITYPQVQINIIQSLAPEFTLAVERIRLLHSLTENTQDIQKKEQIRIARHLHDTIVHDLAYMRLKLDQLLNSEQLNGLATFYSEIEHLHDIANKALDQIRSLLSELQDESHTLPSVDLGSVIKECALLVGARANFQVDFKTEGEPKILPPQMQRQILYLVREILRNVEKHAHAQNITLTLNWIDNGLTINISDNGQGFDDIMRQNDAYYGLRIMQEIVHELNGSLTLKSGYNEGTQVALWLPFN